MVTLNSVGDIYRYLKKVHAVKNQADFATRMGWKPPFLSQLLSTNPKTSRNPPKDFNETLRKNFPGLQIKLANIQENNELNSDSLVQINRMRDGSHEPYVNRYGIRFERQTDGTYEAFHRYIPLNVHAAAPAGIGDPEFMESLPERSVIVPEITEDNYITTGVIGNCQDDESKYGIEEGQEVSAQSYPRSMWKDGLPFLPAGTKPEKLTIKKGEETIELPSKRKREHPYWILLVPSKGLSLVQIKEQKDGVLTCVCRNPDKKRYPDFKVNMDECTQIFYVIEATRKF